MPSQSLEQSSADADVGSFGADAAFSNSSVNGGDAAVSCSCGACGGVRGGRHRCQFRRRPQVWRRTTGLHATGRRTADHRAVRDSLTTLAAKLRMHEPAMVAGKWALLGSANVPTKNAMLTTYLPTSAAIKERRYLMTPAAAYRQFDDDCCSGDAAERPKIQVAYSAIGLALTAFGMDSVVKPTGQSDRTPARSPTTPSGTVATD